MPAIAALLDDAKQIAYNREFNVWTGTLLGEKGHCLLHRHRRTLRLHRHGGSSTSVGADTFIRTGTCGGIALPVQSGDVVVATGAIRVRAHQPGRYAPIEFPAVADFQVVNALVKATKALGFPHAHGHRPVQGQLLRPAQPGGVPGLTMSWLNKWETWKRLGVLASEMESAALFVVAAGPGAAGAAPASTWSGTRSGRPPAWTRKMSEDTSSSVKVAVEGREAC